MILCPETVSRNLQVLRNLPKSSLNQPNRHKKSKWPKKAKNYKFGLKKAKLATLSPTAFLHPCTSSTNVAGISERFLLTGVR